MPLFNTQDKITHGHHLSQTEFNSDLWNNEKMEIIHTPVVGFEPTILR